MASASLLGLLKGDRVDIVDYATDHYKTTGLPLKLAVNASSWWYANLRAVQAEAIRAKSVRSREGIEGILAHPIESNILYYTLRILQLGIELHFVFDGPKPLSNGKKLYPGHEPPSQLFRETLTHIGVPWHKAPAEAEAECAKMEMEGLVHGVWSEDGDALAFGCRTLIQFNYEATRKDFVCFRVYKLDNIAGEEYSMGRGDFILYAILNGKPDDVKGLSNLSPHNVLDAVRRGIGKSLYTASNSKENLRKWVSEFDGYLKTCGGKIQVPPQFPGWQQVQDYVHPDVSTLEALLDFAKPRDTFADEGVDEIAVFSYLVENFQWTKEKWVKYVVPVRIVRSLLATKEGQQRQHNHLKLECDPRKQGTNKLTARFLLSKATSVDISALNKKKGQIETQKWILRKANLNQLQNLDAYFTPPNSEKKDRGSSSAWASRDSFLKSNHKGRREPLSPISGIPKSRNRDGSSKINDRHRRQRTPSSPTPTSRKRSLPRVKGARAPKNAPPAPKNDPVTIAQPYDSGKGKEKEIPNSTIANKKRPPPPQDSKSSLNGKPKKRAKVAAEQLPSTPPAQMIEPLETVNGCIMIESDTDDGYGSFPSVSDFPIPLFEQTSPNTAQSSGTMDSLSSDEYGSFPPSPDLRDLP